MNVCVYGCVFYVHIDETLRVHIQILLKLPYEIKYFE